MSAGTETSTTRHWALPLALLVATVALVVVGGVFLARAHTLRHDGAMSNRAIVDKAATGQLVGQVSTALNAVLSYDYTEPQVARAAAKRWLAGDAPKQYALLFAELQKTAHGQNLTLSAKVSTAGVKSLRGNAAQLLVFVDQQSTRASDHQSSVSAAQVQIAAHRYGSTWKITELKPL